MAGVWCHLWHVSVLVHHTLFKMTFLQRRMEVAVSSDSSSRPDADDDVAATDDACF